MNVFVRIDYWYWYKYRTVHTGTYTVLYCIDVCRYKRTGNL